MSNGEVVEDGKTEDSINKYLGKISHESRKYKQNVWNKIEDAPGGDIVRLHSISVKDDKNQLKEKFNLDEKNTFVLIKNILENETR